MTGSLTDYYKAALPVPGVSPVKIYKVNVSGNTHTQFSLCHFKGLTGANECGPKVGIPVIQVADIVVGQLGGGTGPRPDCCKMFGPRIVELLR